MVTNMNADIYSSYANELSAALDTLDDKACGRFAEFVLEALRERRRIYVCGNGGSAANASHFAGDTAKSVRDRKGNALLISNLSDNQACMMAIANDIEYSEVFRHQLDGVIQKGDILVAISGSGNSPNVVKAVEYANTIGATTVGLCGFNGGKLREIAKLPIHVKCNNMEVVEDVHLSILHYVKRYMMRAEGSL
jgi:D-sedoheptulose 7-phosphate isomerase